MQGCSLMWCIERSVTQNMRRKRREGQEDSVCIFMLKGTIYTGEWTTPCAAISSIFVRVIVSDSCFTAQHSQKIQPPALSIHSDISSTVLMPQTPGTQGPLYLLHTFQNVQAALPSHKNADAYLFIYCNSLCPLAFYSLVLKMRSWVSVSISLFSSFSFSPSVHYLPPIILCRVE